MELQHFEEIRWRKFKVILSQDLEGRKKYICWSGASTASTNLSPRKLKGDWFFRRGLEPWWSWPGRAPQSTRTGIPITVINTYRYDHFFSPNQTCFWKAYFLGPKINENFLNYEKFTNSKNFGKEIFEFFLFGFFSTLQVFSDIIRWHLRNFLDNWIGGTYHWDPRFTSVMRASGS